MIPPGDYTGNTKKAEKDKNEILGRVLKSGISIFHKLLAVLRWDTVKSRNFCVDTLVIHLNSRFKIPGLSLD